jgi:hypothetical protein
MALCLTLLAAGAACPKASSDDVRGPDAAPSQPARAVLQQLKGAVSVKRAAADDWSGAQEGMALLENDTVRTGTSASALVRFPNGSAVLVGEDALIGIAETRGLSGRDRTDLTVKRGTVDATLDQPATQDLSVGTPAATVRAGREIVFQ